MISSFLYLPGLPRNLGQRGLSRPAALLTPVAGHTGMFLPHGGLSLAADLRKVLPTSFS